MRARDPHKHRHDQAKFAIAHRVDRSRPVSSNPPKTPVLGPRLTVIAPRWVNLARVLVAHLLAWSGALAFVFWGVPLMLAVVVGLLVSGFVVTELIGERIEI